MNNELWEGIGCPVRMDRANLGDIDPTLDACCRREVRVELGTSNCMFHHHEIRSHVCL